MERPASVVFALDRKPNPAWPLTVPLIGLPIWWLLGVWQFMVLAMAIPMGIYLVRQRSIAVPRGFGLWLLWMVWLITGILVLQVDAPSAVPGFNLNRYVSFGFRYAWYVAATIVSLYVVNTRHILTSQRIIQAAAWLFVWFTAGGILGLYAPGIDSPSVLQALLPDSVASNSFVNSLMRIRAAQVQEFLGPPLPRPSAPFFYTNQWGFATAISLPFLVAAWWVRGRKWKIAMVIVLAAGLFAIVSSLNRGVWIAVLAAVGLAIVQTALQGRFKAIAVSTVVMLSVVVLVLFSPLSDLVNERLDNGDSDEIRGNLAITAVESAAAGSPIVGFGSTRDVAGTFSSIAGGASELCPRCEAPPLGSHGQLWLVTFGAGFVGVLLYVGFIVSQFVRTVRVRSPYAMAASASLLMLVVTLPFYDSVGIPIYLGLLAVGLLARESRLPLPSLDGLVRPVTRHLPLLGTVVLVGGLVGQGISMVLRDPVAATQRVLVPPTELVPVPGVRASTLDSEAELVRSETVITAVAEKLDVPDGLVRKGLKVGAEPNTRVLLVTYQSDTVETARLGAETAVAAFMQERAALVEASSDLVHERYAKRQMESAALHRSLRESVPAASGRRVWRALADIEAQWTSVSGVLATTGETAPASAISGVVIVTLGGKRVVLVASGLALGLMIGIPLVQLYDRRFVFLGRRPMRRGPGGVVVVATVPANGFPEAMAAVSSYTPVAGVLAGSESGSSLAMAAELDRQLPTGSHAGKRTLLIVDRRSRADSVRQLVQEMARIGMDPVGLVLRGRGHSPIGRRVSTDSEDSGEKQ